MIRFLTIMLLLIGTWRVLSVVSADPIVGYANQYDMARTSACLNFWPITEQPRLANVSAPIQRYQWRDHGQAECYVSSEVWIDQLTLVFARWYAGQSAEIDLRWIGGAKALLLLCAMLLVHWQLSIPQPAHSAPQNLAPLLHALLFAVVISDPLLTLYLNTLYTEFAAALACYLLLGLGVASLRTINTKPSAVVSIGFGLGLLLLSCSRVPNAAVALLLVLPAILWIARTWLVRVAWFAAVLVGVGLAIHNQARFPSVSMTNAANTLLHSTLPAAKDPVAMIQALGLPTACSKLNYTSAYVQRGTDSFQTCFAETKFSRLKLLGYWLSQPADALRFGMRGVVQSQAWRLGYVGEVAGVDFGKTTHWSITTAVTKLSPAAYLSIIAGIVGLLIVMVTQNRHAPAMCWLLVSLLILILAPSAIALLGDGYSEFPRHAHLASLAICVSALVVVVSLITQLRDQAKQAMLSGLSMVLVMAGAFFVQRQMPLAIASFAQDKFYSIDQSTIQIDGWALDPFEVDQVFAIDNAGLITPLQRGDHYASVFAIFPGYALTDYRRIVGAVPVASTWIEIRVRNRVGVETVVDRMWAKERGR
jgi:hypothetical protein